MSIEIYHRDCMEYMATQPDNAFDLAIIDPPYGIGADKGVGRSANKFKGGWDHSPPSQDFFDELFRVSKNQIIWGANHFADLVGRRSPCWVVWDKKNGTTSFADCELAYTSFKSAVRLFAFRWNGFLQEDMKNKETRIHPTQKPVALYRWLLEKYAKPGDRILDTHLGSGSSAIAAAQLGFDFVGCELDEGFYKAATDRIANETAQIDLIHEAA